LSGGVDVLHSGYTQLEVASRKDCQFTMHDMQDSEQRQTKATLRDKVK